MAVPLDKFDDVVLEWEKNFKTTELAARKRSAAAFLTQAVNTTPQDTGETVSNWQVGVNSIPQGTVLLPAYFKGKKGSARNANVVATLATGKDRIRRLKTNQALYIVNYSPVLNYLEQGLSAQAPRGNIVANAVRMALASYQGVTYIDGRDKDIDREV